MKDSKSQPIRPLLHLLYCHYGHRPGPASCQIARCEKRLALYAATVTNYCCLLGRSILKNYINSTLLRKEKENNNNNHFLPLKCTIVFLTQVYCYPLRYP